jgi:hypothetical protein
MEQHLRKLKVAHITSQDRYELNSFYIYLLHREKKDTGRDKESAVIAGGGGGVVDLIKTTSKWAPLRVIL